LVGLADFSEPAQHPNTHETKVEAAVEEIKKVATGNDELPSSSNAKKAALTLGGLHYNFQIILPSTRDPAVYDAIFKRLKEHLIE